MFRALGKERVYGPFLFMETTITGIVYLHMLQQFLTPQLDEDDQEESIHLQQDGAPPHYLGEVRKYLNTRFTDQWIGTAWPPTFPDLTSPDVLTITTPGKTWGDLLSYDTSKHCTSYLNKFI
jgi:hypothetical protein